MRCKGIFLMAALLTLCATKSLRAVSEQTELTRENLATQDGFQFTVKADRQSDGVHFLVTIAPKGTSKLSTILESGLSIMDGANPIASCSIEPRRTGDSVAYEFVVAEKYLESSTFNFGNMAVSNGMPMPAGDFYWFHLKNMAVLK